MDQLPVSLEGLLREGRGVVTYLHAVRVLGKSETWAQARSLEPRLGIVIVGANGQFLLIALKEAIEKRRNVRSALGRQWPDWKTVYPSQADVRGLNPFEFLN